MQQMEVNELKRSIEHLSPDASQQQPAALIPVANAIPGEPNNSVSEQAELERLQKLSRQLETEIAQLEQLRQENEKLRQQLSLHQSSGLSAAEMDALEKQSERALSIQCINNLKQLGLAVRTWALDENDTQAPNLICMSNELSTPKILVCPADKSRQVAPGWGAFSLANCSYEYFVPPGTNDLKEPNRVISRCPIHGHVGLADGSVQSVGKNHPDWFVNKNGKLYLEIQNTNPERANIPATKSTNAFE